MGRHKGAGQDSIPITTLSQLKTELSTLRDVLLQDETEHNWEKMDAALQRFAKVIKGGASSYAEDLVHAFRETDMVRSFSRSLLTERTRLSGAALDVLTALTVLGTAFQPLLHIYTPVLIKLLSRPNKIYVLRTQSCLTAVLHNTKLPTILPFLTEGLSDKSATVRQGCMTAIFEGLAGGPLQTLVFEKASLNDRHLSAIEETIRKAATDKDPKIRETARAIWQIYLREWNGRVESFSAPLTPIVRRYLNLATTQGQTLKTSQIRAASPTRAPLKMRPPSPLKTSTSSKTTSSRPVSPSKLTRPPSPSKGSKFPIVGPIRAKAPLGDASNEKIRNTRDPGSTEDHAAVMPSAITSIDEMYAALNLEIPFTSSQEADDPLPRTIKTASRTLVASSCNTYAVPEIIEPSADAGAFPHATSTYAGETNRPTRLAAAARQAQRPAARRAPGRAFTVTNAPVPSITPPIPSRESPKQMTPANVDTPVITSKESTEAIGDAVVEPLSQMSNLGLQCAEGLLIDFDASMEIAAPRPKRTSEGIANLVFDLDQTSSCNQLVEQAEVKSPSNGQPHDVGPHTVSRIEATESLPAAVCEQDTADDSVTRTSPADSDLKTDPASSALEEYVPQQVDEEVDEPTAAHAIEEVATAEPLLQKADNINEIAANDKGKSAASTAGDEEGCVLTVAGNPSETRDNAALPASGILLPASPTIDKNGALQNPPTQIDDVLNNQEDLVREEAKAAAIEHVEEQVVERAECTIAALPPTSVTSVKTVEQPSKEPQNTKARLPGYARPTKSTRAASHTLIKFKPKKPDLSIPKSRSISVNLVSLTSIAAAKAPLGPLPGKLPEANVSAATASLPSKKANLPKLGKAPLGHNVRESEARKVVSSTTKRVAGPTASKLGTKVGNLRKTLQHNHAVSDRQHHQVSNQYDAAATDVRRFELASEKLSHASAVALSEPLSINSKTSTVHTTPNLKRSSHSVDHSLQNPPEIKSESLDGCDPLEVSKNGQVPQQSESATSEAIVNHNDSPQPIPRRPSLAPIRLSSSVLDLSLRAGTLSALNTLKKSSTEFGKQSETGSPRSRCVSMPSPSSIFTLRSLRRGFSESRLAEEHISMSDLSRQTASENGNTAFDASSDSGYAKKFSTLNTAATRSPLAPKQNAVNQQSMILRQSLLAFGSGKRASRALTPDSPLRKSIPWPASSPTKSDICNTSSDDWADLGRQPLTPSRDDIQMDLRSSPRPTPSPTKRKPLTPALIRF